MVPYSTDENEYIEFNLKYIDKFKDFSKDFDNLSEKNKTRILLELQKILPAAIFSFEQELNKRKFIN